MERRSSLRVGFNQSVRVTALGGNRCQMAARALDASERGIRLLLPADLKPGDLVRIDVDDALLLGEVCYCQPGEGGFTAGIKLDQALDRIGDLARLHRALFDQEGGRQERRESPNGRVILLGK